MRTVVPTTLAIGNRRVRFDYVVDLDYDDPVAKELAKGEFVLSGSLVWLLSSLGSKDVVLDLGAHLGTFALPAAMLGCRVVAVEGSPINAALLRQACIKNKLVNIDCRQLVVHEDEREVEFVVLGPYGTVATPEINANAGYPTVTAKTTTVDLLTGGPFTWAKVDIEGMEKTILSGASRTFKELKGMVIESNGHMLKSHGSSPEALVRALKRFHMSVYEVGNWTLRPVFRPFVQPETIVDYVAVRGRLPLPTGWTESPARTVEELLEVLLAESRHPVAAHRAYAERTMARLPWRLSRRLERTRMRTLPQDDSSGWGH
jgi:FkbM family methyltransferase